MSLVKSLTGIIYFGVVLVVFAIFYLVFFKTPLYSTNQLILVPLLFMIVIVLLLVINREDKNAITGKMDIDQAKNDFVSLASHQLCTPLSAINWYTEMLLDGDAGELNKEQTKYLSQVYHSTKRMIILVNALLNVSRIDLGTYSIEPEPISITKIADEVLTELPPAFKDKQVKVIKKYDPKLTLINADPYLTRIILQNLLSNSIKYTPEGGTVEFSVRKKDGKFNIKLQDSGCGIPKEQHSKIFTRFFRADNVRRLETDGTGLGLYIVKEIVIKSGGKIWFESEEGKGTAFYVTFPAEGMARKSGTKRLG